jgi:hypothetical protein
MSVSRRYDTKLPVIFRPAVNETRKGALAAGRGSRSHIGYCPYIQCSVVAVIEEYEETAEDGSEQETGP